jgi:hypothetical protein
MKQFKNSSVLIDCEYKSETIMIFLKLTYLILIHSFYYYLSIFFKVIENYFFIFYL